jgi:serine/threonine-protein kinase
MKPTGLNNLSAEDAAVILELTPILNIAAVKRVGTSDRKFYIETKQGEKWLLHVAPIKDYEWVKDDGGYEYMATVGINVSRQVSEEFFGDGAWVYQLWTWIEGEDLSVALPRMSHAEQFAVGIKCGEAARKIHSLPPMTDEPEPWGIRCRRNVQKTIQSYNDKPGKSQSGDLLVRYLQDNQELLDNRPTTFIKGDWNSGNLMITPDGRIWLIDRGEYSGDPWKEFWECGDAAYFNTGQIKGYFEGEPQAEYFPLLSYYIALGTLGWYPHEAKIVLNWFDDMRNPVPTWYLS